MWANGCAAFHVVSAIGANLIDFAYFGFKVSFFFFVMSCDVCFKPQVQVVCKSQDYDGENDVI